MPLFRQFLKIFKGRPARSCRTGPRGPNGGQDPHRWISAEGKLPREEIRFREIRINQNPFSPEYDKLGFGPHRDLYQSRGPDKVSWPARDTIFRGRFFWNSRKSVLGAQKRLNSLHELRGDPERPSSQKKAFVLRRYAARVRQ